MVGVGLAVGCGIALLAVLPVVHDNVTNARNISVVLLPAACCLVLLDHLGTTAFSKDDGMHTGCNTNSSDISGTPLVIVLDCISTRQGLLGIIQVDDGLELSISLTVPCPLLCLGHELLSQLELSHYFRPP